MTTETRGGTKETPGAASSTGGARHPPTSPRKQRLELAIKVATFFVALYGFLVSIEAMGGAFKLFGTGFTATLLGATTNPVMGLFVGLLATSLVQSSSLTTSILVGMVAAGTMPLENAIPIVMGANMGTTITSTLVSLGHVTRTEEFKRAFAGATLHDFFNICTVIVLLPIEVATHVLQRTASALSGALVGMGGGTFKSPLKAVVKPASHGLEQVCAWVFEDGGVPAGVLLFVLAMVLLFLALRHMTQVMRGGVMGRIERLTQGYLFKKPLRALLLGVLFTAVVQSSSVTTSLVVPLVGAGVLTLDRAFPYLLGANVGTTVTALLASTVTGSAAAVTVALAHLCFNIAGILVFYPLRALPIGMATRLGRVAARSRWLAAAYVAGAFFGIPLLVFLLF